MCSIGTGNTPALPGSGRAAASSHHIVDNVEEFELSRILDSHTGRVAGHVHYLVAWAGYKGTAEEQTWVTYNMLEHAPDVLQEFHLCHPRKPWSSLFVA